MQQTMNNLSFPNFGAGTACTRRSSGISILRSSPKAALVLGLHLALVFLVLHAGSIISHAPALLPITSISVTLVAPRAVDSQRMPAHKPPQKTQHAKPAEVMPPLSTLTKVHSEPNAAPPLAPTPVAITAPVQDVPAVTAPSAAFTDAKFDVAYLNNPAPVYPLISRRNGEAGKVILRVQVNKLGVAEQVEISQSCGFARLDAAALEAVRKWRFVPARRGDEAIAASVLVPLTFRLAT